MTEADRIFERFPEFIREYIYSHMWESLRGVQIAAAKTIFENDNNLLKVLFYTNIYTYLCLLTKYIIHLYK